jgi:hypothetical protein
VDDEGYGLRFVVIEMAPIDLLHQMM